MNSHLLSISQQSSPVATLSEAEHALRESEARYRHLVQALPAAVYVCDAQGYVTLYNEAAVKLWGREPELGRDLWCGSWRIYRPDGSPLPLDECPMAVALREGRRVRGVEIIIERTDGSRARVLPYPDPIRDSAGRVTGAINMLVDLTEESRHETALRESEERFRQAADKFPGAFVLYGPDRRFRFVNAEATRATGHPAAAFLGKTDEELFPAELTQTYLPALERCIASRTPQTLECTLPVPKNPTIYVLHYVPLLDESGEIREILGITHDITERKLAEQALRESQERFAKIFRTSPVATSIARLSDGRFIDVNDGFLNAFGYRREEVIGRTAVELGMWVNLEDRARIREVLLEKRVIHNVEVRCRTCSGEICQSLTSLELVELGGEECILAMGLDITERKRAEETLKLQGRVIESMTEAVILAEEKGVITFTNPAAEAMWGYPAGGLLGLHLRALNAAPAEEHARVMGEVAEQVRIRGFWVGEFRNRRKDGTLFPTSCRITALEIAGQKFWVSVQEDITERKRLEKEILEVAERENIRIGQDLHDGLCQHLAGVAFMSSLLSRSLAEKDGNEAKQAGDITRLLTDALNQARAVARGLYPVNMLDNGLMAALKALAATVSDVFRISCEFVCRTPVLLHDNSVAIHLYRIAQEAITNAIKHAEARHVRVELARNSSHINLAITNDGAPFKGDSEGMGLHIMRYRAGVINAVLNITPQPEGGAVITCVLPVSDRNVRRKDAGREQRRKQAS